MNRRSVSGFLCAAACAWLQGGCVAEIDGDEDVGADEALEDAQDETVESWDEDVTAGYFALLAARPETILARSYKAQSQINADSQKFPNNHVTYDPAEDAAQVKFVNNTGGGASLPNQVRPKLGAVYTTGTLLFVWDAKWHAHYGDPAYRQGLNTHKAFQLANNGWGGDSRRIEPRMRYSLATPPDVARVDTRSYPGDAIGGQLAQYAVKPNTWTRRWSFVEFVTPSSVLYSEWIADATRPPVRLFNRKALTLVNGGGMNQFWFEYNSSQNRPSTAGPLISWFRNLVVLRNLTASSAATLVAQGATVP